MSARQRRQELRRAAGHSRANSQNSAPKSASVTITSANPRTHSKSIFSVKTDGSSLQSTDLGLPSKELFTQLENDYIRSLSVRKQEKALLTQEMFDLVWDVLHDPDACKLGTPQFRWWVRKMFVLAHSAPNGPDADLKPVVLHEDRPVVVREQIYDVLSYCHLLSNHGGRDRTTAVVKEHYSWVPKELVARFVKACPTCVFKRTGSVVLPHASDRSSIVPFSPVQPEVTIMQVSDEFRVTSTSAYPSWDGPADASAASHTLACTGTNASALTLPPLRTLFPHHVVTSSSSSIVTTAGSSHIAAWPTSVTSQTVSGTSLSLQIDDCRDADSYPLSKKSDPTLPSVDALKPFRDSNANQPDLRHLSSLAPTRANFASHRYIGIRYTPEADCGSVSTSPQRQTDADGTGDMVIDPALLSDTANASQQHVAEESFDDDSSAFPHQPWKEELNDYMYVPPLGRYTF